MTVAFEPFNLPYGALSLPAAGALDLWFLPLNELAPPLTLSLQQDANPHSPVAQRLTRKMLLRLLLAAYVGCPARELRLARAAGGKPYIAAPAEYPLSFSLSHSLDYLLVAVTGQGRVGVDMEPLSRSLRKPRSLARRYLAEEEFAALEQTANDEQLRRRFLRLWTRKEAVVKATGGGIVSGLGRFVVDDADERAPRLTKLPGEDLARWQLHHISPIPGMVGCVATDHPITRIHARRVLPPQART